MVITPHDLEVPLVADIVTQLEDAADLVVYMTPTFAKHRYVTEGPSNTTGAPVSTGMHHA
jgi:hypothetical protein